jgi:hypothetical protein
VFGNNAGFYGGDARGIREHSTARYSFIFQEGTNGVSVLIFPDHA